MRYALINVLTDAWEFRSDSLIEAVEQRAFLKSALGIMTTLVEVVAHEDEDAALPATAFGRE